MERSDSEAAPPVGKTVLKVICELRAGRVGEGSCVYAPTSPVVVIKRGDLELVEVSSESCLSGVESVIASCVNAALQAVLHYDLAIDPDGPARGPRDKVVLKVKAGDSFELRRILSQPVFKPSVVVSKWPE